VLISTVHRPFLKGLNYKHNNETEALEMARVFQELGYRVDVVNYDNPIAIDYSAYDVVFGSGAPLDNLFRQETSRMPRTILYSSGSYLPDSNRASLGRLQDVFRDRGVWLPGSARLSNPGLGVEGLVDGVIVLGNAVTAAGFRALPARSVYELPLFQYAVQDPMEVLKARDLARTRGHFIWFAGSGLVHKGLDLVLRAFSRHPELHLHVYGALDHEPGFLRAFQRELRELPNVHVEGFLGLRSPGFRAALLSSAFMICPSCSEACCSSVLNICGNGGIVPILTAACGIELEDFGLAIENTTVAAVEAALLAAQALGDGELDRRQRRAAQFFGREHSLERYHQRLTEAIQAVLAGAGRGPEPRG